METPASDPELIERAETLVRLFNENDVDGMIELADPEIEFFSYLGQIDGREYHGHAGVREWSYRVHEAFPTAHIELVKQRLVGSTVFGEVEMSAAPSGSGVLAKRMVWLLLTFTDGMVTRWTWHTAAEDAERELERREA